MKIDWKNLVRRVKVFFLNLPATIRETFTWLIVSYLIPLINIGIIWGLKKEAYIYSIDILSIVLVTNACFITSLFHLAFSNKNNKKLLTTISIVFYVITITLFVVSTIEMVIQQDLFSLKLYQYGTLLTLLVSILLALISKYDEQVAISKIRAQQGKDKNSTIVGDKSIRL